MGLFKSRDEKIAKFDKEIANHDQELMYKDSLSALLTNTELDTEGTDYKFFVLHKDLQAILEELKKLNASK